MNTELQPLTKRQAEILESFIRGLEHGRVKSKQEIADEFRINGVSAVYAHFDAIQKKGYIAIEAQGEDSTSHAPRKIALLHYPDGRRFLKFKPIFQGDL